MGTPEGKGGSLQGGGDGRRGAGAAAARKRNTISTLPGGLNARGSGMPEQQRQVPLVDSGGDPAKSPRGVEAALGVLNQSRVDDGKMRALLNTLMNISLHCLYTVACM